MSDAGGSMENLDAELWSELKPDLVEVILTFLPVPVLSRYRTVCKSWNRLIRSPMFGAKQMAAAAKGGGLGSKFVMMRSICVAGTLDYALEAWSVLELDNCERWYTIAVPRHPFELPHIHHRHQIGSWVSAIDGGLVCRYAKPGTLISDKDRRHITVRVYNPVDASVERVLPSVPRHRGSIPDPVLTLVVDVNIDSQLLFKVFLISQNVFATDWVATSWNNDPLMRIYDSETNKWGRASNPACLGSPGVGRISSAIVHRGYVYVVMYQGFDVRVLTVDGGPDLWRYSIVDDVWEKVYLMNLKPFLTGFRIFVCANRLFRIGWVCGTSSRRQDARFDISEINIPEIRVPQTLLTLPESKLKKVFGVVRCRNIPEFAACGFGNSTLLICKSSNTLGVLDSETRSWKFLPANRTWIYPTACDNYEDFLANPISHMNLLLPSYLKWC